MEGLSSNSAIDRSVQLSEGGRWRITLGFALPAAIAVALDFGLGALVGVLTHMSPLLKDSPVALAALTGTTSFLVGLAFTPLSAILLTVLYYDQRVRHEGFDIEQLMEAAGLSEGGSA